jgi:hypothetical protein
MHYKYSHRSFLLKNRGAGGGKAGRGEGTGIRYKYQGMGGRGLSVFEVYLLAHYALAVLLPYFTSDEADDGVLHVEGSSSGHVGAFGLAEAQLVSQFLSKLALFQLQFGRHFE